MKKSNLAVTAVVTGLIAMGGTMLTAAPAMAAEKEKCYGVAKAGKNDCATKTSSCACLLYRSPSHDVRDFFELNSCFTIRSLTDGLS